MSDAALRRTVRRCTALLLVPLSLWPILFLDWLHTTRAGGFRRPALAFGDELALLVLLAAVTYLLASFAGLTTRVSGSDSPADRSGG